MSISVQRRSDGIQAKLGAWIGRVFPSTDHALPAPGENNCNRIVVVFATMAGSRR